MINLRTLALAATTILCLSLAMATEIARAGTIAFDSAANPAYAAEVDGAWKGQNPGAGENPPGTDNGGFGFLPWDFGGGYHEAGLPYGTLNHFIDGVDFPTTTYNNLGSPTFGLGNEQLPYITATALRPFAQPMAIGDVFSADVDTPAEYEDYSGIQYPFAIITFRDSTGTNTFGIEAGSSFQYGDFPWRFSDANDTNTDFGMAAGGSSIAPTAPSDGSSIRLEVTSATTGRVTFDGVGLNVEFIAGVPASVTFTLYDNNAEADLMGSPTGEHAFYFDNLKIESAGTPGDYNGNQVVDAADYTVWRNNLGSTNSLPNDSVGGTIGIAQYNQWKNNFGMGGSGSGIGGNAVPEPASWCVILSGALGGILVSGRNPDSGARSSATPARSRARR
jgi:hypothetical protein